MAGETTDILSGPSADKATGGAPGAACRQCGAPLAPDQRYCVECGVRSTPLPPIVANLLAGLEPAQLGPEETALEAAPGPAAVGPFQLPTGKAAAVAAMAMLAFGVLIGGLLRPSNGSALLVQAAPPAQPASSAPPPAPAAAPVAPPAPTVVQAPAAPSAAAPSSPRTGSKPPSFPLDTEPPVKHVFLIVLSNQGFDQSFGANSAAPYLSKTLTQQGELLTNYYGVTQGELANEIALVSGQGPTSQTAANCPTYTDIAPGTVGQEGQIQGDGCVYPTAAQSLADQLTGAGKSWKAYVEDIGNGTPSGQAATCRHPDLGQPDTAQAPQPGDAYVTWRNPFVYFHSVIDSATCATNDVGLDQLGPDLQQGANAPSLSYIVPNRCHDGSDDPCAPGQPSGLPAGDSFLQSVVPEITGSPAYADGGLIAITFDQAPQTGPNADQSACCFRPAYPNLPGSAASAPTDPTSPTGGGGRVGLLLISPFVQAGSSNQTASYNHFSLLASIEGLLGVTHAGFAADPSVTAFDATIYNAYQPGS